ncbi:MAG TPA: glycosyltransferase 87 family protein [Candidatus Limnocylindria bacterium]|nr:glycosyltransferase 87 family protein [Candidatus Limnocylindria bacterium]
MSRIRAIATAIWPYAPPLAVLIAEWGLLSPTPALADHFQFWAAGHMVVTGQSPYVRTAWEAAAAYGPVPDGVAVNTVIGNLTRTEDIWPYPPQTAFLFGPFGALPLAIGVPLLHLVGLLLAVGGLAQAAHLVGLRGARMTFALTLAAVSQPFVFTVRDGHPIGLVLIGLTLLFLGLRDRRLWALGLGVAIASVKPHLAIAFAIATVGVLVSRRDGRGLAVTLLALAAVTIPAELRDPFPIARIGGAADQWLAFDLSTVGALARDLGGGVPLTVAIVLLGVGAAGLALRIAPGRSRWTVSYGALLTLSLVLTPYAHDYDMLLVLPAVFAAAGVAQRARTEHVVVALEALLVAVVPWLLYLWWPLLGQSERINSAGPLGALPVIVALALPLAMSLVARRPSPGCAAALPLLPP